MAPRLIPSAPTFRSAAEETVWKKLRSQLPADSFLAANVPLADDCCVQSADDARMRVCAILVHILKGSLVGLGGYGKTADQQRELFIVHMSPQI